MLGPAGHRRATGAEGHRRHRNAARPRVARRTAPADRLRRADRRLRRQPQHPERSIAGTTPWPGASADDSRTTCGSPPTSGCRSTTTPPSATSAWPRSNRRCPAGCARWPAPKTSPLCGPTYRPQPSTASTLRRPHRADQRQRLDPSNDLNSHPSKSLSTLSHGQSQGPPTGRLLRRRRSSTKLH